MGAPEPKTPLKRDGNHDPRGLRWLVLLPGLALASFASSAALVDRGWSPLPALLVTGALLAALLASFLRQGRLYPWRLQDWGWTSLATIVVAGVCSLLLWAEAFHGLPGLGGGDAGNHVTLGRAFLIHQAPEQEGMGAYYTLCHWLEQLTGASPFEMVRGVFYGTLGTTIGLLSAFATHLAHRSGGPSPRRLLGLWVAIVLPACLPAVLPLLHYYQVDGYLPQTLSLVVLVGAAVGYASIERFAWRVLALVLALGLLRYTYVLNAGEAILACTLVVAWELGSMGSRLRQAPALAVLLGGFGLATYGWLRIASAKHFMATDGILYDEHLPSLVGLTVLSVATLSVPWCHPGGCSDGTRRFARFVGLFGLLSAGTRTVWLLHFDHRFYYECKHGFAPTVLVTLGLSLLLAELLASAAGTLRTRARAVCPVTLVSVIGLALTAAGAAPYWPSFAERVLRRQGFAWLTPLQERQTETMIQTTLALGGYRFGGFVTPRWPESSFTNAAFDYPQLSWHGGSEVRREAGYCAFWYDPATMPGEHVYLPAHRHTVAQLEATRTDPCVRFSPDDGAARELVLCHRCFRAGERAAPFRQEISLADDTLRETGFYDLEREGDRQWRWTTGDGRLALPQRWPEGQACELALDVHIPRSLEVWLDDRRLEMDERGHCSLPPYHSHIPTAELRLRSPTIRPGPQDERDLGVQLFGVVIQCQPR